MAEHRSYEVVRGDSLWLIAWTALGNGERWPEIYTLNQSMIDAEVRKRFRRSKPDPQNWIFPGMVLQIPPLDRGTRS